jgi:chromate reductase
VLGIIGADVIDHELPVGQADTALGVWGELVEPEQRAALAELVSVLLARAGAGAAAQAA